MKKKLLGLVMAVIMIFSVAPVMDGYSSVIQVEAASKTTKKKALSAYRKFLSKKTIRWGDDFYVSTKDVKFSTCDVNGDGIKELILTCGTVPSMYGWDRIYTYSKGKVKSLGDFSNLVIYKNKNYMVDEYFNRGLGVSKFYRLKNGKLINLVEFCFSDYPPYKNKGQVKEKYIQESDMYWYYYSFKVNGKSTSYNKCMKTVNSLRKNSKATNLKFRENTSSNRKKYIK